MVSLTSPLAVWDISWQGGGEWGEEAASQCQRVGVGLNPVLTLVLGPEDSGPIP